MRIWVVFSKPLTHTQKICKTSFSVAQSLSRLRPFATLWIVAHQLGQILNKRYKDTNKKETKKPKPNLHFWRAWSKSRVLSMLPAHNNIKEWAKHLRHPSSQTPGHTSTLTLYKEQAYPTWRSEQASELVVCSPTAAGGPNKVLPKLLLWPLVIFFPSSLFLLIWKGQEPVKSVTFLSIFKTVTGCTWQGSEIAPDSGVWDGAHYFHVQPSLDSGQLNIHGI